MLPAYLLTAISITRDVNIADAHAPLNLVTVTIMLKDSTYDNNTIINVAILKIISNRINHLTNDHDMKSTKSQESITVNNDNNTHDPTIGRTKRGRLQTGT